MTICASRRADVEHVILRQGQDEGTALRARRPDGAIGFAAADGLSHDRLAWCLARCREEMRGAPGDQGDVGWPPPEQDETLHDHEAQPRMPLAADVVSWLERAWDGLEVHLKSRGLSILDAWVEAGGTIETWASGGRHRASRSRVRGWAMARLQSLDGRREAGRPLTVARRPWSQLDPASWIQIQRDRAWTEPDRVALPGGRTPVLFDPASAALLVRSLAGELHRRTGGLGLAVGRAWRLVDDPLDPEAIAGGSFDDAGFPTRRAVLADGEAVRGELAGPGHWRRSSFRDRPAPMASHLVVDAGQGESPPSRGLLVSGLGVHALTPEAWLLRLEGHLLDQGLPGPGPAMAFVRISPRDLVRRCVATIGPARLGATGVCTPALVFDDLDVQAAL